MLKNPKLLFLLFTLVAYPLTNSASDRRNNNLTQNKLPLNKSTSNKVSGEIAFLLSVIKKTRCKLNRNGTLHNGQAAEKHIRKKYNYARKKIKSAEQFIAYAATSSSFSGRPYMLVCPQAKPQTTTIWLLIKLASYRRNVTNNPGTSD